MFVKQELLQLVFLYGMSSNHDLVGVDEFGCPNRMWSSNGNRRGFKANYCGFVASTGETLQLAA